MSFKFNPFTGTFDIVSRPLPSKVTYDDEIAIIPDNNFVALHNPLLLGSTSFIIEGDSILEVM